MPTKFPKLSKADADNLLRADLANIARKVKDGKTLTRDERRLLNQAQAGEELDGVAVAKTYTELAEILGVTRQTVQRWRKFAGAPKPASNGEHDVEAWRDFQREIGGKGAVDEERELEADIEGLPKASLLRRRRLAIYCAEKELSLSLKRGELIDGELVRATWEKKSAEAIGKLKRLLTKKRARRLSKMEGPDIHDALAGVVDEFISSLVAGKSIETG